MAEARAGDDRVGLVSGKAVGVRKDRGDATLRVLGVGLVAVSFGHDQNGADAREVERERQACDAAAENEEVRAKGHRRRCFRL